MREEELKPCPFCGGRALATITRNDDYWTHCDTDGTCSVYPETDFFETRKEAIDAWNKRALDQDQK